MTDAPLGLGEPWTFDPLSLVITSADGKQIARLREGSRGRLLAATPTLYQSLAGALECLDRWRGTMQPGLHLWRQATSAKNLVLELRTHFNAGTLSGAAQSWTLSNDLSPDVKQKAERLFVAADCLVRAAFDAFTVLSMASCPVELEALHKARVDSGVTGEPTAPCALVAVTSTADNPA